MSAAVANCLGRRNAEHIVDVTAEASGLLCNAAWGLRMTNNELENRILTTRLLIATLAPNVLLSTTGLRHVEKLARMLRKLKGA